MRTNIVLDDELVREAMEYSTARTKRSLVEEALHAFIRLRAAEKRRENYRARLTALLGQTEALALRKSPSKILREDRDRQ